MKLSLLAISFAGATLHSAAHNAPTSLEFVKNKGQWHSNVQYRMLVGNGAVFMENNCITYAFADAEQWNKTHEFSQYSIEEQQNFSVPAHAWRMHFESANNVVPQGEEVQKHYYNYFNGNDPAKWASFVPVYHAARYAQLYSGIDMRSYSSLGHFKFDFIVKAGADPAQIGYHYTGQDAIQLIDGKLVISTSIGTFTENTPFAYQMKNGIIVPVACNYVLENGHVRFEFPEGYDTAKDLVIDPELIAATLSGTSATNYGHSATFDLEGNIYTGCISFSAGYPTTDGAYQETFGGGGTDFGISKLNPEGTDLIWASYVGGSDAENPHSMVANNLQELYVYGSTSSSNFPNVAGCYDTSFNGVADIVIVKFSADGSQLLGATFMGGSETDGRNQSPVNYGDTYRGEIIMDNNQEPLVASFSSSDDFPVTNNAYQNTNQGGTTQDVVAFRLNSDLTNLEVSTYLGSSENDTGYAIRQATNGNIYVAGMAGNNDFPVTAGAYQTTWLGDPAAWAVEMDGFVACFNSNLSSLLYSTFIGTDTQDQVFFMDLDNDDNVFVYGQGGADMPIVGTVYANAGSRQFVTKFSADLSTMMLSTQLGTGGGGGGFDFVPVAFLVDHCNNIYISSYNAFGALPLVEPLYSVGGFYLAVLTENLEELEFATMYSEGHVDGGTSRFDKNGTVYQGVCSGGGFTTTPDAWATDQTTGWDVGVFKIDFDVSGVNAAISGSDINGCAPFEVTFSNFSTGDTFLWDFGDGAISTDYEPTHIYVDPGVYEVSLIATDSLSCNIADTSLFDIVISTPVDYVPDFSYEIDCTTQSIICSNTTGYDFLTYVWEMGDGTTIEDMNAEHTYLAPGTYTITLTAIDEGCLSDSSMTADVTIFNEVVAVIGNDDLEGCAPFSVDFENNSGGITFQWDFGDGSPLQTGLNVSHNYTLPGDYTVTLYAEGNAECPGSDTITSVVNVIDPAPIEALFSVEQIDACQLMHITAENQSTGPDLTYQWTVDGNDEGGSENLSMFMTEPGMHSITLQIFEATCDQQDEKTEIVEVINEIDLALEPDMGLCYNEDQLEIHAAVPGPGATYTWNTGDTGSEIAVTAPGQYIVLVNWNNCAGVDTVNVVEVGPMTLVEEVKFCEGSATDLHIPVDGSSEYTWCNGESGQTINVDQDGQYCYNFIDELGCMQEGIINVYMQDFHTTVFIPNAFTPNNDGINDVFQAKGVDVSEFDMTIWNRWGDQVFATSSLDAAWTGSYHAGGDYYVPDGVYSYYITYRGFCSSDKIKEKGYIVVTR